MKIDIVARSIARSAIIEAASILLVKRLGLSNSRYSLTIRCVSGLAKNEQMRGGVARVSPSELMIALDSRLGIETLVTTLSHEFVHVKQHAKGQLVQKTTRSGKVKYTWMGKSFKGCNYTSPWELEAYGRERILANEIFMLINSIK